LDPSRFPTQNKWTSSAILLVLAVTSISVALAEVPTTAASQAEGVRDAMDKTPAPPWEWVRHEPAGARIKNGALELQAMSGSLWGKHNVARNLLVRPSPFPAGEPFAIEVRLNFAPRSQAEQAGLMIYFDDANYVKVVREWLDGQRFIVMAVENNDEGKAVAKVPELADTVTLRLTYRGQHVLADYRAADGDAWKAVGRCELPAAGAGLKLGISAYGGPGEQARPARFSSFVVSRAVEQP